MTAKLADPGRQRHWTRWYGLSLWFTIRANQLAKEPLCAQCFKEGRVTPATVADHEPPHKGNWNAFRRGPLQSLCEACHERKHGRLGPAERASKAVDDDGFPTDPRHPFNKVRR